MKETILKILKYTLLVGLVLLVVLLLFGLVFLMSWPWWVGIFLVVAAIGLFIAGLFVRKLLLRRKEQHFVQQVIDQDNELLNSMVEAEKNQHKQLNNSWKEAVDTLRRSHLKKHGNPLYVLPWYLIMGESGSGKSTAISSAKLASPFAEVNHASGVSGTRNCDWWFFDQSIIIDTAGRYAMPIDSGRDNEEWQKFLSLLVKYRKREPINGLIMTVAADKLLSGSPEELERDGQQLRRRLDELMRVLGIKFPVYLLVTKCDLIQGMTQFSERLPEKALAQPMGVVNQELSRDVAGFVSGVISTLAERLKNLRVLMLNQNDSGAVKAGALLFPDEFAGLKKGMESFVKAAFQENRYQDTPLLRGIYFSSGRQEGTPFSHFLGDLGLISEKEVLPGTSKGLFLHDFFDKVLPRDRSLFAPTTRAMQWQSLTRNLGITSWIVIWIAICGLLSYSFVKNMATIRIASAVMAKAPELKGDYIADIQTMDQFRNMILTVEKENRHWWVPRFWLNESLRVEKGLKARYCKQFQERFLASFDKAMANTIIGFSAATPDDYAGQYMVHLVRRINLLKLRLEETNLPGLAARPLPSYVQTSAPRPEELETSRRFGDQYLNYLLWRGDSAEINREIATLQSLLKQILSVKGGNLHWLPDWVNRQGGLPPLTLRSFWGGTRPIPDEAAIAPAYTRKGRDMVMAFGNELKKAAPDPLVVDREMPGFENWYREGCYASWQRFAAIFPKGEERLNGAKEWQAAAELMSTEQGPFFAFMKQTVAELESFGPVEAMPPLLQQIFQFQRLKTAGPVAGAASKAVEEGKKLKDKVGNVLGKNPEAPTAIETQTAVAKACQEYQNALTCITPAAKSRTQAYQLALQVFSEDPIASKSPFYLANEVTQRMKGQLAGGRGDEAFWKLVNGPLNFLWNYVQRETACAIQSQWEDKVLKEAQGASDPQTLQFLLSPEGPVWKFVNSSLGPFLGWTPGKGYYSKAALGGSVPFEQGSFNFLTKGAKVKMAAANPVKPNNVVTIKGLPTDANGDARVKPQSTRLELQCASGQQLIENMNYPISKTFTWVADSCSDVTFQIEIGDLVLTKQYTGPQGFPSFLKDFQGGRHTFYPQDFPRDKAALDRMGVRFIRANYQFSGIHDIMAQAGGGGSLPGEIPRVITKCWN